MQHVTAKLNVVLFVTGRHSIAQFAKLKGKLWLKVGAKTGKFFRINLLRIFITLLCLYGGQAAYAQSGPKSGPESDTQSGPESDAQSGQDSFLSDLDIPLMPNFWEEEDSRVIFDAPEGRIIEVRAFGPNTPDAVIDYYGAVLPSLSWRIVSQRPDVPDKGGCEGQSHCITARLNGEIITITALENEGIKTLSPKRTTVYFSVNPE